MLVNAPDKIEVHPVADIFPALDGDAFRELCEDIKAHGLREPIKLDMDGRIIDGRNRYSACLEAGVKPRFEKWLPDGNESVVDYVVSMNLRRRHMSESQRSMVAAELANMKRGKPSKDNVGIPTLSQPEAAKLLNVSRDSVVQATKVREKGTPELVGAVKSGKASVHAAAALADAEPEKQRAIVAKSKKEILAEAKKIKAEQSAERHERKRRDMEEKKKARAAEIAKSKGDQGPEWKIITGDCLAELKKFKSGTARLVFADPPYNIGIDYGSGKKADWLPEAKYLAWVAKWIAECKRILTPDGSLWLMICDEYADHFGILLREAGFHRRNWIKWYETFGVNCGNKFNRTTRHIFYTAKDPDRFVFNDDAEEVRRPSDRQAKYKDERANPEGKLLDDFWQIPRVVGTSTERIPDFPTQLPTRLLDIIVAAGTKPGDLVVDPFNGSGTTGVASLAHGCRYIGIEKVEAFADAARLRLRGHVGKESAA